MIVVRSLNDNNFLNLKKINKIAKLKIAPNLVCACFKMKNIIRENLLGFTRHHESSFNFCYFTSFDSNAAFNA